MRQVRTKILGDLSRACGPGPLRPSPCDLPPVTVSPMFSIFFARTSDLAVLTANGAVFLIVSPIGPGPKVGGALFWSTKVTCFGDRSGTSVGRPRDDHVAAPSRLKASIAA